MDEKNPLLPLPKHEFVSQAVTSISDQFFKVYGRRAQLDELPSFAGRYLGDCGEELLLLIDRDRGDEFVSRLIKAGRYPNFFLDVHAALKKCKVTLSRRPQRTFT